NLYRCAVAIAGVSDLGEMLRYEHQNGSFSTSYQYWVNSIGDPTRDRAAIAAASPRSLASRATAPLLLIHGETDAIVPIEESEFMDAAMHAAGKSVRFVRIPQEGHVWSEWSTGHRQQLFQETADFLAQHLGPVH